MSGIPTHDAPGDPLGRRSAGLILVLGAYLGVGGGILGLPWTGPGGAPDRLLGWILLESLSLALWIPLACALAGGGGGSGAPRRRAAWLFLFLGAHGVLALAYGRGAGTAVLLQIVVADFAFLTGALYLALRALGAPRGLAQVAASAWGLLAVSGPFLANPFVEHAAAGSWRGPLVRWLLAANPVAACAAVLRIDWLRSDVLYEISVIGRYYPFREPDPWGTAGLQGALAGLLVGFAWLVRRRAPDGRGAGGFFG